MPSLGSHHSSEYIKLLNIANSGAGKTGALASLAQAGYELFILDHDNGLDILANLLRDDPDALSRVHYATLTDKRKILTGKAASWSPAMVKSAQPTGIPNAYAAALTLLTKWVDPETKEDFGDPATWGPGRVVVIDTLGRLADQAMDYFLAVNARLGQQPEQSDYGAVQRMIEDLLGLLYAGDFATNVLINTHIKYTNNEGEPTRGFPLAIGKALPPKIGTYFNTVVYTRATGTKDKVKRLIHTEPTGIIDVKTTAPGRVKPTYDIAEGGLAELFMDLRGATKMN